MSTQTLLHNGPGTVVFGCQRSWRNFSGLTPTWAQNTRGVGKTRAQQYLRWATVATIDMGLKEGGGAVRLSRSAGNPSNTMWPVLRSNSIPSGFFIHRAVWPQ